jgi:branched-chain amino acid transport system ATP-binding protein
MPDTALPTPTAAPPVAAPQLVVQGLKAWYGATQALHGLDFALPAGRITALLGANGAGKTTTLRALCQLVRTEGSMLFEGRQLGGRATEDVVRLGLAHVPDGRGTFHELNVEENLRLGAYARGLSRAGMAAALEQAYARFPILKERRRQQAGTLSGGQQQMLAISRGLMLSPKLLLLDEPSFGLAPLIVAEIFAILRDINQQDGVTMLLVEQNASLALELAEQVVLLETGRVVLAGASAVIKNDAAVRRAYLGY